MRLLHIFQYWTHTDLWFKPSFWYFKETTPKGYTILSICGIAMVFDRPDISI